MGIRLFSTAKYDAAPGTVPAGNPNPRRYEIITSQQVGRCLLLKVQYPDCKNYEGVKILVYLGVTLEKLEKQGQIDPHFSDDEKFISPVARFVPTEAGWALAKSFAFMVGGKS